MSNRQIEIFTTQDGQAQLRVALDKDTVWLTQAQMAELFAKDVRTINEHIGNLYSEHELEREATIRKFRIVRILAKPVKLLINDNTLVALALLVAESKPEQKELMIRLVEHFILLMPSLLIEEN